MNTDRMTVRELAQELGKSPIWVIEELRRDSKREARYWPFAISKQSKTGRWSYVILRAQFKRWKAGDNSAIDYERLADMIADRLIEKLSGKGI